MNRFIIILIIGYSLACMVLKFDRYLDWGKLTGIKVAFVDEGEDKGSCEGVDSCCTCQNYCIHFTKADLFYYTFTLERPEHQSVQDLFSMKFFEFFSGGNNQNEENFFCSSVHKE